MNAVLKFYPIGDSLVELLPPKRVVLTPIPWGKKDRATAEAVIQNMIDTTPGTVIPWSNKTQKLRTTLQREGVRV